VIEQASETRTDGGSTAAVIGLLEADPHDTLAATLASLGRALGTK
jgi:hypothetical protein